MNIQLLKYIILFIIIFLVKHSIAQEAPTFQFFAPGKITAKDTTVQPIITIPTFGDGASDTIPASKDSIVKSNPTLQIDTGRDQVAENQKQYELLNKRIIRDSIAIRQLYKLIDENSEKGSITRSTTPESIKVANATTLINKIIGRKPVKPSLIHGAISFDVGQVFSTFKFTGNNLNFSNNVTTCFSLSYRYSFKTGLFAITSIGMRNAGASLFYEGVNINWNIQYAHADIGLGYIINKSWLKPYFAVSPYLGYMIKGNQTNGTDYLDIKKEKSMKTIDYGVIFSPGFKIALSKYIACYAEYNYILGLQNIEKPVVSGVEPSTNQKTFNRAFSFNLGVAITVESLKTIKFVK